MGLACTSCRSSNSRLSRAGDRYVQIAVSDADTTGMLAGLKPEIGHELAGIAEAREVAQFSAIGIAALTNAMPRIVCRAATTGANVQSGASLRSVL
jgi:hypothetical protein